MQGYSAFLADQGLPYDVLVDVNGSIRKIQVKTTQRPINYPHSKNVYRFGLRNGRGTKKALRANIADYFAFVALDIQKIAYLKADELLNKHNKIKQCIEFKSVKFKGGKYIGDYSKLPNG